MENVRVRLEPAPVSGLQFPQFCWFAITSVRRKMFIDEQVPDLLVTLPGTERFILGVANPPEFFVRSGWFRAVTLANQLDDAFAMINLLSQNFAKISALRAENFLPNWLITEKCQCVSDQLPRTFQLTAHSGNEHQRTRSHGTQSPSKLRSILQGVPPTLQLSDSSTRLSPAPPLALESP